MPHKDIEKRKEYLKQWNAVNKEHCADYRKKWLADNREKRKQACKLWRENNRERARELNREFHRRNPTFRREQNLRIKKEIIDKYGGKCANPGCRETDIACLSIDHINNDGAKERHGNDRSKCYCGKNFYCKLRKIPRRLDLQVLCMNCQFRKIAYGQDFLTWPDSIRIYSLTEYS